MLTGRCGRLRSIAWWLLLGLLAMRVAAPSIITAMVNRDLGRPGTIQGHIDGVGLGLLSGTYTVEGMHLTVPKDGAPQERVPLLELEHLRCRVFLGSLIQGKLEGSLALDGAKLHVHVAPPHDKSRNWSLDDWRRAVGSLVRLRIADASLTHGTIAYHDPLRRIEANLNDITGHIVDLIVPAGSNRPARFHFASGTPGGGDLQLTGTALADADTPQAEIQTSLEHVRLIDLNPMVESYHDLSFADGTFSAYGEMAIVGEQVGGYLKPIFRHLQVRSFEANKDGLTDLFWAALIPVSEYVLRNVPADQHAARIPISGRVKDPKAGLWSAISSALSNSFISAIVPGFDHS